jgi:hypothetical protein
MQDYGVLADGFLPQRSGLNPRAFRVGLMMKLALRKHLFVLKIIILLLHNPHLQSDKRTLDHSEGHIPAETRSRPSKI